MVKTLIKKKEPKSSSRKTPEIKKISEVKTDTRDKLLDTAIKLIWQSNYHNVGVNEICQHAGVTKGCFYHYFSSKASLYESAAERYWQQMKAEMDAIFSPSKKPLEQLEGLIGFIIAKQEGEESEGDMVSGCPFFTSGAQASEGEETVQQVARTMSDNCNKYGAALVANLSASGYLNSQINPEKAGRMIGHYIQGALLYGCIFNNLEIVKQDLREGLYRLLDLKQESRV